ncbi:MAG: serine/threonine protein kinase [Gemmataceae bacterium]
MRKDEPAPPPEDDQPSDSSSSSSLHFPTGVETVTPATTSLVPPLPPTQAFPEHCEKLPNGQMPRAEGYDILTLIGRGSFGRVYRARELATGKLVAIKFILQSPGPRWQALLEEVRQHARLDAVRGIVDLKHVEAEADPPYFVMAHADRGSLADRLARERPLPLPEALDLFEQAVEALAYVHAKGLCHCDLKPGNILLDARGKVLLADFGQMQTEGCGASCLGTLFYMPPDQADLRPQPPDPSWDVYALGAVLYVMLTGEQPRFNEEIAHELTNNPDIRGRLERYREWVAIAPMPSAHHHTPGIDTDLIVIIDRCLQLHPRQRYAEAGELLVALQQRRQRRRRRPLVLFALVASLFALFITAFTESRANQEAIDTYETDLTRQLLDSNTASASLIARAIHEQMRQRIASVTSSVTPELARALKARDRPAMEAMLRRMMTTGEGRVSPRFAEATVTNERGQLQAMVRLERVEHDDRTTLALRAIDPATIRTPFTQFSWRDWFSGQGDRHDQTRQQHPPISRTHVSDPYASALDPDGLFVSISVPIRATASDSDPVLGVMEAAILMKEMSRWIREAQISRSGSVVVFDNRHHCVIHTGAEVLPRRGEPSQKALRTKEEQEQFSSLMGSLEHFRDPLVGRDHLGGYVRIRDGVLNWVVLVEHDREQIGAPIQALRKRLGNIGWQSYIVVMLLVGGLWVWLFRVLRHAEHAF